MHQNVKKNHILILFILAFIFYGFSFIYSLNGKPHFSSSNDFSNHAHMMYQFAESFKSGQFIPRTVVNPVQFSDATSPTPDIPTFQYYGSFEGFAALPFHLLGASAATAAILSSILVRFLGLFILYETCLLLGATVSVALLASFSFLISPYMLTVFYGRGALAETFAQSLLTLIPYGYALAYRGRIPQSIIAFAMAFFLLSLCHNIFFLYGLLFAFVLVLFSFQYKIFLSAGIGVCLGICMSAWQWLPAKKTISDTVIFGGLNSWKLGDTAVGVHTASLNGALGIPQPWTPAGFTHSLPLYHTIGWWTLPCIALLIGVFFQRGKKRVAISFFISSFAFFMLTFWPFNEIIFQKYAPNIFGILQDSSRLLGLMSLLGAVSLAIALPKINPKLIKLLFVLMIISQIPVLNCYLKLASQQTWTNDQVRGAPINYYYSSPIQTNSPSAFTNTREDLQLKRSDGSLNSNNSFYIASEKYNRFFVRLKGIVGQPKESIKISIVALNKNPLHDPAKITTLHSPSDTIHSDFTTTLEMPAKSPSGWYKILFSSTDASQKTAPTITLTQLDIVPNDLANFISAENIENSEISGYSRKYAIKTTSTFKADQAGYYWVELPIAYSKLFAVTQNHNPLPIFPDFNHRMLVQTKDLNSVIHVNYKIDYLTLALTFLGVSGFLLTLRWRRRYCSAINLDHYGK